MSLLFIGLCISSSVVKVVRKLTFISVPIRDSGNSDPKDGYWHVHFY